MNAYLLGFTLSLLPIAWIYNNIKNNSDNSKNNTEEDNNKYKYNAQYNSQTSKSNQQLFEAIFKSRNEPDLYTALGERNRKSPQQIINNNKHLNTNTNTPNMKVTHNSSGQLYSATGMMPNNYKGNTNNLNKTNHHQ
jgi:hypothetical protein